MSKKPCILATSKISKKGLLSFFAGCALVLGGCGGGGSGSGGGGGGSSNVAPRITGQTNFSFPENQVFNFELTITDPDSTNFTITVPNTGDGQFFTVTSHGRIQAIGDDGFNFENPLDSNGDNVYSQTITVSDGIASTNATITVTITDVNEPPTCSTGEEVDIDENSTGLFYTFLGTDPEGDTGQYRIDSILASDGLFFDFASELISSLTIDADTGEMTVTNGIDADVYAANNDLKAKIKGVFATGSESISCDVIVNLIDLPSRVSSGALIEGKVQEWGHVGDIDGDGTKDIWVMSSGSTILEGSFIYGSAVNAGTGGVTLPLSGFAANEKIRIFGTFPANDSRDVSSEEDFLVGRAVPDLDGDGKAELLLGLRASFTSFDDAGRPWAYLLWGKTLGDNTSGEIDLDGLAASDGITIKGPFGNNLSRAFMNFTAADFDGDNLPEIAVGAPSFDDSSTDGRLFIINGTTLVAAKAAGILDVTGASNAQVAKFTASNGGLLGAPGNNMAPFGDIDNDGIKELLLGNRGSNAVAVLTSTAIKETIAKPTPESFDNLQIAGNLFVGSFNGQAPILDTRASDFDGDGVQDILFGHNNFPSDGIAGIIFGSKIKSSLTAQQILDIDPNAATLNGYVVFKSSQIGTTISVTGLGDLDGDNLDEFAIGFEDDAQYEQGVIFVVKGSALSGLTEAVFNLDNLTSTTGLRIEGNQQLLFIGRRISAHDDIDGDGKSDLAFVANLSDKTAIAKSTDIIAAFNANQETLDLRTLFDNEEP